MMTQLEPPPSPVIRPAAAGVVDAPARTVFGFDPVQLHARYWAAHGVQVVRQGEPSEIVRHAELFLLTEPGSLALFKLGPAMDTLNWIEPQVLMLRLHDPEERPYREQIVTDDADRFVRFNRIYAASGRLARVALTPDADVAQMWQGAPDPQVGWRRLRRFIPRTDRTTLTIRGSLYDVADEREVAYFLHDLMSGWRRLDATIGRARLVRGGCWADADAAVAPAAKAIGPVWVGAGRALADEQTIVGPAVLWDAPDKRPDTVPILWQRIEPARPSLDVPVTRDTTAVEDVGKRAFDIAFASVALAVTLPLYPLIMLAIWLEDGRPLMFVHRRETRGGREFPCIKFRSMRHDAEQMKVHLREHNQADGPQFFIENDPRLTRVGRVLRKFNLDELPQFINVLFGQMSVVGPRASPFSENQFSPAWREARLSVKAGITGLWQVKRTRRTGSDFQEWIKYDLEYVQNRSLWLDLKIVWQTVANILGKMSRS